MANKITNFKNRIKSEKGNYLVFFVMIVLPILSLLFMMSFEVSAIYVRKRKAQDVIDDAALLAIRSFPYQQHMGEVARQYLIQNDVSEDSFDIGVTQQGITIDYHQPVSLIFSRIANAFAREGQDEDLFTWIVGAHTFVSPQVEDYMILLDRSKNVAPQSKNALWGDAINWPASTYITNENIDENDKRFFTQQCFNPVFSHLKEASISLYNYLGNFALNQVGFMVTPGGNALTDVNYLLPMGAISFSWEKRGWWMLEYEYLGSPTQKDCYNIAYSDKRYGFINDYDDTNFYVRQIHDDDLNFDNNTSFQRDVWALPSHMDVTFQFHNVLGEAIEQLIAAPGLADRRQDAEEISKTLIFLTASLPNVTNNEIRQKVQSACNRLHNANLNMNIKVVYALYDTKYFVNTGIDTFRRFLNGLPANTCNDITFSLIVAREGSGENITDEVLQYLQLNKKRGHLWR